MFPLPPIFRHVGDYLMRPVRFIAHRIRQWSHEYHRVTIENNSQWRDYNETITLDLYLAQPNRCQRLTLLHPVLGGDNIIASFLAHYFAFLHRRNCVVVHRGQYPFKADTPQGFEQRLQAYLYNYRIAENHMQELGIVKFGCTQIISIGVSMGGIVNSILATQDRYDRYITIMAGAPIIEVMYRSNLSEFQKWFNQQMKQYNITREMVLSKYDQAIETDFIYRYQQLNPQKLFTISTLFDSAVATYNQRKLIRLGQPHSNIWLPTGHYSLFVLTPIVLIIISWWSASASGTTTFNNVDQKLD